MRYSLPSSQPVNERHNQQEGWLCNAIMLIVRAVLYPSSALKAFRDSSHARIVSGSLLSSAILPVQYHWLNQELSITIASFGLLCVLLIDI